MRLALTLLVIAAPFALGQGAKPTAKGDQAPKKESEKKPKRTIKPLPPGKVRVFKAIVLDVKGIAQGRAPVEAKPGKPAPKGKWKKLVIQDVLEPGTVVRTGRKSQVTLRVGVNATILIDRQSRVAIPEIVQRGKVLRTRVSLGFGKADVKVDRIGLDNDFEVATPTATLAVRGTAFRIWWDVVKGFRSLGVPGNKIRAIELTYLRGVKAWLSKADSSSEAYKLPALDAFYATYLAPLEGALSPGEQGDAGQDPDHRVDPIRDAGLDAANAQRGSKTPTGQRQNQDK